MKAAKEKVEGERLSKKGVAGIVSIVVVESY
jgi:hypothetical protein